MTWQSSAPIGLALECVLYSTLDVLMIRNYTFICLGGSTPPPRLPRWHSGKESTCQCRSHERHEFDPWVEKIPWRTAWKPTPVLLPGESNGQRSLVGYSPWGLKEWDTTEHACTHTHTCTPLFPHFLFLTDSSKFTKCLPCARTGPCSSEAAMMNGTWSLPYNIHCLMGKETRG